MSKPGSSASRRPPLAGRYILVVEDDPDILRMIATVLEAAGAQVASADAALHAERFLAERAYDAVLLDWNLDDLPAPELLARIADTRPGLERHVLVMTGDLIGRGETHEAERRGLPLLRKPFRPRALIEAVQRALRERA